MKKITVCLACFKVMIDDVYISNHETITKLMLTAKYLPESISVEKIICPICRKFLSDDDCKKILKDGG